jgi:hypothetical protein
MAGQETPVRDCRLVEVLADMLCSALAWENEHNCQYAQPEGGPAQGLTGIHGRIHCWPPDEENATGHDSQMLE